MPHPFLIISQSANLIHIADINSHTERLTVQSRSVGLRSGSTLLAKVGFNAGLGLKVKICYWRYLIYPKYLGRQEWVSNADPDQMLHSDLGSQCLPLIQLGPAVQSVVSLTSSIVVKILTVLGCTISNFTGIFAEKMWVAYHIFSAKILVYMPYLMFKILMIR